MNIPQNLKYTQDDEWVRVEGEFAYVGITDYAQHELGDIVFVDVDCVGDTIDGGAAFGSLEAVKTVADLLMPAGLSRSNPPTWPTSTVCSTLVPTPPRLVPNPTTVIN